ncbi:hypothetical protein GGX14DRAFT_654465 [Mycena pura]|uniref:F-box domain-containing protein n=1 Tax=Mycena pura TaxID=153505 RepID=A0AAD6V8A3_9AGAR|nr:hypothetical protein GGX14DRAFT_654465 [Mycena pura]
MFSSFSILTAHAGLKSGKLVAALWKLKLEKIDPHCKPIHISFLPSYTIHLAPSSSNGLGRESLRRFLGMMVWREPASVPVARVPPEILCEIFGYFTSRNYWDERKELASLHKADLLVLARVYSRSSWALQRSSDPQRLTEFLGAVLDSLIFTILHTLDVLRTGYPIFWPVEFEALARRSAFQNTTRSLDPLAVCITQDEFLRSLPVAALGSLESLAIADHPAVTVGPRQYVLLTDALLSRLTWSDDDADSHWHPRAYLVPRLNRLHCAALFRFSPQFYRDFIASWIAAAGSAPFENSPFRLKGASSKVADGV